MRSVRPQALLVALALAGACTSPIKDDVAPEAPTFDPLPIETSHASILLAGHAEPGATLVLTRVPAFPRDFVLPTLVADAATARFSVVVPLAPGALNRFTVHAVDDAGLESPEATTSITQGASAVVGVLAVAEAPRVRLDGNGKGAVRVRAQIHPEEHDASLRGHPLTFTLSEYPQTLPPIVAETDSEGLATAIFQNLTKLGPGRITVVADVPAGVSTDEAARDFVTFEVVAGEPATATLTVSAVVAGSSTSGASITVPAGTEVRARVVAKDAAGNVVPAPWVLTTSPSDAFVTGGVVRFVRAGTYEVSAYAQRGDALPPPRATATVIVTPDASAPDRLHLVASAPPEAVSGVPVHLDAGLVDAFGNTLAFQALSVTTSDPLASFDAAGPSVTLAAAGTTTLTVRATRADGSVFTAPPLEVLVRPGVARTLQLTLGGSAAPLASPRPVTPGAEVSLEAVVKDAAGNAIPSPLLDFSADQGASVFGRTLFAPTSPGVYVVNGLVVGSSARALAAIQVQASTPDHARLTCPATATAGVAFDCAGQLFDRFDNPLSTPALTYSVTAPSTGASNVGARVTVGAAGAATISATAAGLASPAEATVTVRPAPAATLRVTLAPSPARVGQEVVATTSVVDAFGNVLPLLVQVSTDAPDALASPRGVTNLTTPGTWHVFTRAVDDATRTALTAVTDLVVQAEAPASVRLSVSPSLTVTGAPVRVTTSALDPFGNPSVGAPAITINGAPPDQRTAILEGGTLTFLRPGAWLVTATLGNASARQWVDVRDSVDATAPQVSFTLSRTGTTSEGPFYRPGETVAITVRSRDDRALAGVRVRVSGSDLGLAWDTTSSWTSPRADSEDVFNLVLPANRVGAFTVTAVASDTSGNAAQTSPAPAVSDLHFDRFTLGPAASSGLVPRSVSVDTAALGFATALAFGGSKLHVTSLAAPVLSATAGSSTGSLGAGGALTPVWSFGDLAWPIGLVAVPTSTSTYFFAGAVDRTTRTLELLRLAPGVPTPQQYSSPPLGVAPVAFEAGYVTVRGLSADVRSTTPVVYFSRVGDSDTATPLSTLWSVVAKTTPVASVDPAGTTPKEAWSLALADYRVHHTCVADVANPTELYFTGVRLDRGTSVRSAGLYRVTLQGTGAPGQVPATGTPVTLVEEARDAGGSQAVDYGPCVHVPGSTAKIVFSRYLLNTSGGTFATSAGSLRQVTLPCAASPCAAAQVKELVSGTVAAPLGGILGLARGVAGAPGGVQALYASETAGRVFRLDGLF